MESANVNFDEHTKLQDDESIKKLEEYGSFVYFYEGMPTKEEDSNQFGNQQKVLVSAKSHPVNTKLHSNSKLQNQETARSNFEVHVHEREVKIPKKI